jgi:chromosome segregation ATPase
MKKWMYIIFPGIGLALFLVLYFSEVKKMEEKERAHAEEVAKAKQADDERKAKLQQEANESAAKKAKERADELAKKEADRAAKWKAEGDKIQEDTDKANAEAAAHTKKIADLESQINALRNQRDQGNREYLDLIKAVELTKVDRRNAELEIQRMTKMIADKAADSSMTRMPPPPVAVAPAR